MLYQLAWLVSLLSFFKVVNKPVNIALEYEEKHQGTDELKVDISLLIKQFGNIFLPELVYWSTESSPIRWPGCAGTIHCAACMMETSRKNSDWRTLASTVSPFHLVKTNNRG